MIKTFLLTGVLFAGLMSCAQKKTVKSKKMNETNNPAGGANAVATFGTGCFWCTEAIFQELEGVIKVTSGYSGGHVDNPTYKEVCEGNTGHAECLNIEYDSNKISFDELLEVFWQTHNPTTLNRQGNDIGTQYRSVIFYHNEEQKAKGEKYKAELNKSGAWDDPVVTTLEPFDRFYAAEDYHQNYYNNNTGQGYCQFVIRPKLEKFEKVFKGKLKKSSH
jgi:peptide-methionine (S)-S-oxide reductase